MSTVTTERTVTYGSENADEPEFKSGIKARGSAIKNLAANTAEIIAYTGELGSPLAVVAHREKEKRELQDLNDRFCNYIETVRFLEFHNKKLASDVEFYKNKLERLNQIIKQIFETELNQAREIIDDNKREADRLLEKQSKLERDADEFKDKFEKLENVREEDWHALFELEDRLAEKLALINALQNKIQMLEDEIARLKKEYNRLMALVNDTKNRNEEEIMIRKDFERRIPELQDEIAFKQQLHEQELRELLDTLMKDDTDVYRNIFHNELSNALRDIRKEYEEQMKSRPSNDELYQVRIQEIIKTTAKKSSEEMAFKDQTKKDRAKETEYNKEVIGLRARGDHLRRRIEELERSLNNDRTEFDAEMRHRDEKMASLRAKLEDMMREMQEMMDEKLRLDEEIAQYRKLLSGEETRLQESMTQMTMRNEQNVHTDRSFVQTIESAVRTNIQKRSKGNIAISEANMDDKFVVLENATRDTDQKMDGWQLRRRANNDEEIILHIFPAGTTIKAGRNLKIPTRQWTGKRDVVVTTLFNERDDDMATVTQRQSAS